MTPAIVRELRRVLDEASIPDVVAGVYLADETEARGLVGRADAVALPASAEDARAVVAWCYAHDVAVIPRGGGTGFAGGCVPLEGGVVLSLERLRSVRSFDPLLWRMEVEAGRSTAEVAQLARESGLYFPPDPGAAEQSQIGGNVATNAGGPHAFKYGVTGDWVTGLEAVVAPGELITVGGAFRKDVAGYDLKNLLVGSEGTLGVVTSVRLRLMPAPETAAPVIGFYPSIAAGCAAIERVLGSGISVAALEFLDAETLAVAGATLPGGRREPAFMVVGEVDGAPHEVDASQTELVEALAQEGITTLAPTTPAEVSALWRWRDGVSMAVQAYRGGKASEDIVVPIDRLAEAIEGTHEIGRRFDLPSCAWGHAGDGNLHSTFMLARDAPAEAGRARLAAEELFALAAVLGGSISGEHGVGLVKNGQLARQWDPRAIELHAAIKRTFDPKCLLNPGKKIAA
ncbi:MAG: FAD-binding oxidoreductase [Gemmatimonadaceae bacterium]